MSDRKKNFFSLSLILFAVLVAYGNCYTASWHFDDYHTIIDNPYLTIDNLEPETIWKTFFAAPGGGKYSGKHLYRPVPNSSFAINWYLGKDDVLGYHIVNVAIHFTAAVFLYFLTHSLLKASNKKEQYHGSMHTIAFVSTLIWAVHPIHTQAVTYIVQRMTSMSAMFGILSLWLYVAARNKRDLRSRLFLFAGSAVAFIMSIGSKENGGLLLVSMLLMEVLFFRELSKNQFRKFLIWSFFIGVILFSVGMIYLTSKGIWAGYEKRNFTLVQRLVTEPRVLILYLSQLFWAFPWRFSIEHDIAISHSIFNPWTTMPAILAVLGLLATGIVQMRKRPLISLAILFYFLNHVVESSILPLELTFEHRNYLPSAFVFLPISQWIVYALKIYRKKGRIVMGIGYSAVLTLVFFLVGSTFLRNDVWATEKSLWENAISRAPGLARPYQNLAYYYYEAIGRYDIALELYKKAIPLGSQSPGRTRAEILTNIGVIYDKAGDYASAYEYYLKALEASPKELKPRYNSAMALIGLGRYEDALMMVDDLISRKSDEKNSNNLKGFILLKAGQPIQAIPYFEKTLGVDPNHFQSNINMGIALSQLGRYGKSEKYLMYAQQLIPSHGLPIFCLLENSLRKNDIVSADKYLQKLINSVSLEEINTVLKSIGVNPFLVPLDKEILLPAITRVIQIETSIENGPEKK